MQILLNGAAHEVAQGATLGILLQQLGLEPEQVAIEHNRVIVPRGAFETKEIRDGDSIEMVEFIGGG